MLSHRRGGFRIRRRCDFGVQKTYQYDLLGAGLRDHDSLTKRYRATADLGWFRSYILYVDDKPVAFQAGTSLRWEVPRPGNWLRSGVGSASRRHLPSHGDHCRSVCTGRWRAVLRLRHRRHAAQAAAEHRHECGRVLLPDSRHLARESHREHGAGNERGLGRIGWRDSIDSGCARRSRQLLRGWARRDSVAGCAIDPSLDGRPVPTWIPHATDERASTASDRLCARSTRVGTDGPSDRARGPRPGHSDRPPEGAARPRARHQLRTRKGWPMPRGSCTRVPGWSARRRCAAWTSKPAW